MASLLHRLIRKPRKTPRNEKIVSGALALAYVMLMGYLGSSAPNTPYYLSLQKSVLTPPNIVFPIVWTALFFLLAASAYLVWNHGGSARAKHIFAALYLINGFCIGLWSLVFFKLSQPAAALILVIFMVLLSQAMLVTAFYTNRKAGFLLIPYAAWLFFALYLNAAIVILNDLV